MSEGIALTPLTRHTLLPAAERLDRLQQALPQIRAVIADEHDEIALQATLACLLWETFVCCNWVGFYRRINDTTLKVGPYQGTMGCLTITLDRGVCGAAARTGLIQRVADVHAFEGHIACDDRSRSELVIPVICKQRVVAVLDMDSPHVDAFSEAEALLVDQLLRAVFSQ
jgi:GAF domain-containing protein